METNVYGPADRSLWLQRPMGRYEAQMARYCPSGPGPKRCNVNFVTTITVKAGQTLNVDHVKAAVMATIYNEPNLRADIDLNTNPGTWVPATDFGDVFKFVDLREKGIKNVTDMMSFIEDETNRTWEYGSGKPLYRCTLVQMEREYAVMNCYHHSAGDGVGGMIIIDSIMKQYNLLENGKDVEMAPHKPGESIEDITSVVRDDEMVKQMLDGKIHRARTFEPFLPLNAQEIEDDYKNDFPINKAEFRSGTAESFTAIVHKCKEKGVTVGSLYLAASYLATAAVHALKSCPDPLLYEGMKDEYIDIPVNMRRRMSPPLGDNYCAFYVTFFSLKNDVNLDSSLWQLAKEVDNQVQVALDQQHHFLFSEVKDKWENEHIDLAFKSSQVADLACSNVGRYPFQLEFPWGRVTSCYVAGAVWLPSVGNNCFLLLSTDRFHYSIVYCPGQENSQQSLRLFDIFYQTMEPAESDMTLRDILTRFQEKKQ